MTLATSDGTNSYVWNARNQLASMNSGGASFQYDPFGRRVAKTELFTTTNYLYDGANPIQELSGSTVTANLLTGPGADERFTRTDSGGTANFLTDALGSALALTDGGATTLASYTYDPFGNTTTTGSSANTYQYTRRENDGTGIYFYRARYYSPTLQRFMSEDPIGFNGGGANFYAYSNNSPTNLRDPDGQNPACLIGGLFGTMGYNGYVIYQSLAGRKANYYAGLSGFGHILKGNALAFAAGCTVASLAAPAAFSVPANAGVVYGGGAGAAQAAANAAVAESGGALQSISQTVGGQIAQYLTAGSPSGLSGWVWDYASAQFASGLEGTVTVFQGSFGAAAEFAGESDLVTVETPILQSAVQNGTVNLVYGVVP